MDYGKIVRKLRKERGITQTQLADGITARVTLTDFENKNTGISFQTLLLYLNRMNIRIDEFFLLYAPEELKYIEKRTAANQMAEFTQKNADAVFKGIAHFQKRYEETEDSFYYFLVINLKVFLMSEDILTKEDLLDEIDFLMRYFEKIDTFGRFEIIMMTNCIDIFSEEFLLIQHKKVIEKLMILSKDPLFQSDISAYANNLCVISYKKGYEELLTSGILLLKEIGEQDERYLYERLVYRFFKELTQDIKNNQEIQKILTTMESLGMNKLSAGYRELYENSAEV